MRALILTTLVLALLLRVVCLDAEFWLDEIWSAGLARQAGSLAGVFAVRHDNNHHLNTAWLRLLPEDVWPGWYRLHSLLAGLASVLLAARIGSRWGKTASVIAAWLVACNYWLVLASSEARGYALAV